MLAFGTAECLSSCYDEVVNAARLQHGEFRRCAAVVQSLRQEVSHVPLSDTNGCWR